MSFIHWPRTMSVTLTLAMGAGFGSHAAAASLKIDLEIPRLDVAEYHRPYVALWIEGANQTVVANLNVWYQQRGNSEGHGTKWLPDLRQWWRRSGRTLKLPVDGVTGPTRPVGTHALNFDQRDPRLARLAPGEYTLVVEAVREVGGRELLKIPFTWRHGGTFTGNARGQAELGTVKLRVVP